MLENSSIVSVYTHIYVLVSFSTVNVKAFVSQFHLLCIYNVKVFGYPIISISTDSTKHSNRTITENVSKRQKSKFLINNEKHQHFINTLVEGHVINLAVRGRIARVL